MPYLVKLPEGRSIVVFFYDAPVSQAVAFEKLLVNGEKFAARLLGAFDDSRGRDQLVHIATDGESYGHHFQFGDMALAYALHQIETSQDTKLTIYGEFLESHPPWTLEAARFMKAARGAARMGWNAGKVIAVAARAGTAAGISNGERLCAMRWIFCATGSRVFMRRRRRAS